jgi:hypothetical protein
MTRLRTSSRAVFATGENACFLRPAASGDRLIRLFVHLQIGKLATEAVVDTGGAYLVLDPDYAAFYGVGQSTAVGTEHLQIRGFNRHGTLHRVPVILPASAGDPLTFEATAFLPDLAPGEHWLLPTYLGWQGCLERIRFAVDPREERVYFGSLDG